MLNKMLRGLLSSLMVNCAHSRDFKSRKERNDDCVNCNVRKNLEGVIKLSSERCGGCSCSADTVTDMTAGHCCVVAIITADLTLPDVTCDCQLDNN